LFDRTAVEACEHVEIVAHEGDADLFFWETFPIGNRLRNELRRGLALQACRGIEKDVIHEGRGAEVEREGHMWTICDRLAKSSIREKATRAVIFVDDCSDVHLPVFKQAPDHIFEEIGLPVSHWHEQHEQHAQPFDILRVADAELGAKIRLVGLLATYDASILRQQGRVSRIVAGETGKAIEHLLDGKRIPHEVEQLGGKQVDDLGLDIIAAAVELGEQALRMNLNVAFVFVEQRLEIES
jgi:hypothetical protein